MNVLAAEVPKVTDETGWESAISSGELKTGVTAVLTRDSNGNYVTTFLEE